MPAYIAMLRGVNVTGHNSLKMERLRGLCNRLGFQKVETYVQSGNIVFQAKIGNPAVLSKRIGRSILDSFGLETPVVVRTLTEMENVVGSNPFLKEKNVDSSKLHVTFLSEAAQKSSLKRLEDLEKGQDRFYPASREIYLYCPGGYGRTKLSNNAIEKVLSVTATTRNWRTTSTLLDMVSKL
jgi:uncharacterized protein (DUF1697 family)